MGFLSLGRNLDLDMVPVQGARSLRTPKQRGMNLVVANLMLILHTHRGGLYPASASAGLDGVVDGYTQVYTPLLAPDIPGDDLSVGEFQTFSETSLLVNLICSSV